MISEYFPMFFWCFFDYENIIENMKIVCVIKNKVEWWFPWCVCATCLPAYPWANRDVPRSYSDGAPTSCRVFLVRTLDRVVVCRLNQQTKKMTTTKYISLQSSFFSVQPDLGFYRATLLMKCPPAQRKKHDFFLKGGTPSPPSPPQKGQKWRFCRGSGGGR